MENEEDIRNSAQNRHSVLPGDSIADKDSLKY